MKTLTKTTLLIGMLSTFFLVSCGTTGGNADAKRDLELSTTTTTSTPTETPQPIDDLLRKGDVILIRLSGVPVEDQGVFEVRIDEAGQVSMPLIGSVSAAGSTTVELKKKIETAYRDKKYYTNPNITVVTAEKRFVNISGEVRMPQRVLYTKDLTAYGAIAACSGFTDYANRRRVKLLRGDRVIEFNAIDIGTDPSKDILLQPNDQIQVDRSIF